MSYPDSCSNWPMNPRPMLPAPKWTLRIQPTSSTSSKNASSSSFVSARTIWLTLSSSSQTVAIFERISRCSSPLPAIPITRPLDHKPAEWSHNERAEEHRDVGPDYHAHGGYRPDDTPTHVVDYPAAGVA